VDIVMSNLLSGLGGMGGSGLKASQDALQLLDKTSAETTKMNAQAQSDKMKTDTVNSIMNGYVDSANKANNAATQSGKAINY
jgi:hypothetical protein